MATSRADPARSNLLVAASQGVRAVRRLQPVLIALPLVLGVAGCEAIGLKANIVSMKSINGKTEVKHREAKNWDEFKSAMGEVGTDFGDVAKAAGATTGELVKVLTEAPPPGKVTLSALDPSLKKWEGNEKLDFIAAAKKQKKEGGYDFTYVQIGVPSYDNFFKTVAEAYGLAFQMKETGRRIKLAAGTISGNKLDDSSKPADDIEKAKAGKDADDDKEVTEYFDELEGVFTVTAKLGIKLVGKMAELVGAGQQLIMGAPSSITNPKTVIHIKLIVKGLEQSVDLVKSAGGWIKDLV
jgi:hypothetical protein